MKGFFARIAGLTTLVVAVVAFAVGAGGATAAGNPATTVAAEDQLESEILAALNATRRAHGLVPLKLSRSLTAAADAHSRSMATYGYFSHVSRDGLGLRERVGRYYGRGQRWAAGENLLWSTPTLAAPEAMKAWMESGEHRKNILRPLDREIGLSAVSVPAGPGVFEGLPTVIVTTTFGVRY